MNLQLIIFGPSVAVATVVCVFWLIKYPREFAYSLRGKNSITEFLFSWFILLLAGSSLLFIMGCSSKDVSNCELIAVEENSVIVTQNPSTKRPYQLGFVYIPGKKRYRCPDGVEYVVTE